MQPRKHFLLVCFVFVASFGLFAQTSFFIAPDGNDKNEGSIKKPFRTIEKAQLKAREIKGETTIYLRGGVYRLARPIVFTQEDGNESKRLILRSYFGERAVVSGGVQLSPQWKPYRDGIMKAKINAPELMDFLIVNGEIRHLARYPNYDSRAVRFNGTSADATSPERVKTWKNPAGGFLHAMHRSDWGDFHYRITGKDNEGNLTTEGGWQNNRQDGLSSDNRMVENIFEELDTPGEWFYNASESTLYYFPLKGEDIHKAKFEVAQLKSLIEFRGTEQKPVKNIAIQDIEFTQTARTFMEKYEPLLRSDWRIYRGGAILFEGAEQCSIKDCYLHNLGGNAVFVSNYNRDILISGSHFTNVGAGAICFVGNSNAVRSPSFEYGQFVPLNEMDRELGPKTNNYTANCTIYDNLIHHIGLFEKQITGVQLSMCRSITVSHNSIYDVPRAGVNISEGTWGGHIIEFNDIFDTVKETGDHGSFNSWGRDRYWHPDYGTMASIAENNPQLLLADAGSTTIIRNNRFRCDRGWDIDLDDGSTNYHIYNNLCLTGGIKLREGFYRVVENNILINNTFHPHVWFNNSGDVFARNIVMTPYQPINIHNWGNGVNYNIFTNEKALEESVKNKTDDRSIVYPVRFENYETGDYRITPDAVAVFRMGFQNFEMDKFGVVSPRLKRLARTPKMSIPVIGLDSDRVSAVSPKRNTVVSIKGESFLINGTLTFKGKSWRGYSIEGLLPNSRMVNGIFDDETDSTRYRWIYPDTKKWDAERNTREFVENMPLWRKCGLLAFTINLQGGNPYGYSNSQPWKNSALDEKGMLKPAYMNRLTKIIDKADELGMVVILGIFYFGQEKSIDNEAAILTGIRNTVEWVAGKGYTNVIIEINNECDIFKIHPILRADRVHEAIQYAKNININGRRLLVGTSYGGGAIPSPAVVKASDFILMHGNGVNRPERIVEMVRQTRQIEGYTPKPILFNEDDHYDFDKPMNNFVAATGAGASWGLFDYRKQNEPFEDGYQSVPADWGINSERKKGFFNLLSQWENAPAGKSRINTKK